MASDSGTSSLLTRRAALAAGWTAAGAGAMAALWPRVPRSRVGIPPGRVVVEYWEKWTGPEGDAMQRVVDGFNASQDRIFVRRTAVSEIGTKAMVAIGGGDPPDVCGVFSYHVPQYAQSGAVIPVEQFGGIDPETYLPSVRRLLSHEGRLVAGVTTIYTLALYRNRSLFRAAGLDPDAPPATLDELDSLSRRLTSHRSDGTIERAGFLPNLPSWWPYTWPILFGSTLYDPATNRSDFDRPACIEAYEWVRRFPVALGEQASRAFGTAADRSYHSPNDPFISGRVAMIAQGPWLANFINRYAPGLDYAASALPVHAPLLDPAHPLGMVEADVLVIPREARHPEAAFEFVRHTQRPEVHEQLATDHTKGSALKRCSEAFLSRHPNRSVRVHDAIARSERACILPQTPVWKSYAHLTEGVFDAAWKGDDVAALCSAVHRRVQGMLDRELTLRWKREAAS